jgi:hypothetical protein
LKSTAADPLNQLFRVPARKSDLPLPLAETVIMWLAKPIHLTLVL